MVALRRPRSQLQAAWPTSQHTDGPVRCSLSAREPGGENIPVTCGSSCLSECSYDNRIFMKSHVSATHAARHFSDLLNRVRSRGEKFVVERGGEPVCEIIPARPLARTVADLVRLLRSIPKPDKEYWDTLEDITTHQPPLPPSLWQR